MIPLALPPEDAKEVVRVGRQIMVWVVEAARDGKLGLTPRQIDNRGRRMRHVLPDALAYLEAIGYLQPIETKRHRHGRPTKVLMPGPIADRFVRDEIERRDELRLVGVDRPEAWCVRHDGHGSPAHADGRCLSCGKWVHPYARLVQIRTADTVRRIPARPRVRQMREAA